MSIRKKFIGIILPAVLCLFAPIAVVSVEAADNTYTVDNQYTVSIPASVTINSAGKTGTFTITGTLNAGLSLDIAITSKNSGQLVNQASDTYKLDYTLSDSYNGSISTDGQVSTPLKFDNKSNLLDNMAINRDILVTVTGTPTVSGVYEDNLTFAMTVGWNNA